MLERIRKHTKTSLIITYRFIMRPRSLSFRLSVTATASTAYLPFFAFFAFFTFSFVFTNLEPAHADEL